MKTNSFKAWVLAARPKTLTAASVPVLVGLAAAWHDQGALRVVPAVLCMLFAFVMQIDANFVNDYFDWRKGNDDEATRLGPLRACSQGWVTPRAMIIAMLITTGVGCLVGLPLIFYGGWEMILVGVACVLFCVLYTTTLSYLGLGDVLVLVFFGLVPTVLTYYLQTGTWDAHIITLSLVVGLVVDTLLLVNNYRDHDNDKRDGKRTLVVFVGRKAGLLLYLLAGMVGYGYLLFAFEFDDPMKKVLAYVLSGVYLLLHAVTFNAMRQLEGRALNKVLGMTARNIFLFGLLTTLIVLLSE